MYNFLTKPQLLPITKTTNVHHFYEFQGKQMHEKMLQQKKILDDFLSKIQQEELKEKTNKTQPVRLVTFSNKQSVLPQANDKNKSYFIDFSSSNHSSKPKTNNNNPNVNPSKQPPSSRSFNDFYQKNKKWKQNLQQQILRKKQQKIQQQQRQLSEFRKPLSEHNSNIHHSANQSKNSHSLHHAFDSKGPISGWTQRFHQYINKRLPQCPEGEFKPTINKKSKIIAGRMVGRVEDRLIRFGEILKMRKHQMVIEQNGKIGKLPEKVQVNGDAHYVSTQTNQSDLFFRLYKEGEKTNRRVKQHSQRKQFSFKPQISKLPEDLQKKVQQKRQKSPLYTSKKFTKQQTHRLLQLYTKQRGGKAYSEAQFQNFMKRNQILLQKRNKQIEQKVRQDMIKQEKQFQECTFIPLLNPRSVRMFEKTQPDHSVNDHVDYEYSQDGLPLEESPSQLFSTEQKPTSKKSTHMKPKLKYSYPHSYTEPSEQFQYEINTPSKHEISQLSNSKSPNTQKGYNQVSQLDSLQFSTHKRPHHLFSKPTPNLSPQKSQNDIINYELTFSNTKLAHELSQINHIEEQDHEGHLEHQDQEQPSRMTINSHQPKQHNMSMRSERQMSEYNERKEELENSWENQLEKVKGRLQMLMKGSTTARDQTGRQRK